MKRLWFSALLVAASSACTNAADFEPPVRLKAGDDAVRVQSPGYAAPCLADLKGDGKMSLLVGQFAGGRIQVFEYLKGEKVAPGDWLEVDGKPAEVPGVW